MAGVHGANQILEELEVDGEFVLARREPCVEYPRTGNSALHIDDAKAGAADEPIEKLFAIGRLAAEKWQRKINGPALAGRRFIGTAGAKAGTGLGGDLVEKPVGGDR
jgi:hypothetical protein